MWWLWGFPEISGVIVAGGTILQAAVIWASLFMGLGFCLQFGKPGTQVVECACTSSCNRRSSCAGQRAQNLTRIISCHPHSGHTR